MKPPKCNCKNKANCNPVVDWHTDEREVIIAHDGSDTDYKDWMWESITTVLQIHDRFYPELMCYAHSKGKKFGIFFDMIEDYSDSTAVSNFTDLLKADILGQNADVLALDLLKILGSCLNTEGHINEIAGAVQKVINETKKAYKDLKILCVMPWKPPCYEYNCGLTPALKPYCDGIIISPESYTTYCSQSCRARATVPFTKMFLGLDEYEATGVDKNQLILGIPWHGYDYTCEHFTNNSGSQFEHLCTLKTKKVSKPAGTENKTMDVCDIEGSRKKVPLGQYFENHRSELMDTKVYSGSQQAPYMATKNGSEYHMLWYEDYASLAAKYSAVYHYGIKGCVIYNGDDLSHSHLDVGGKFNSRMWAWLLHTVLATSTHEYVTESRNVAGLVAGVGIGMFLFGMLLGAILACIRFRQKEKLRPPFKKDYHKAYHDEDPDL